MARERRMRRRWATAAVVAVAALALGACRPIQYDVATQESDSAAVWRVRGLETANGHAVEIRYRHCNTVQLVNVPEGYSSLSFHLHPTAKVVDATGKVFFNTTGFAGTWVQPAGSQVYDNDSADDDLQRIVVPVAGAKAPLTIDAECTSYAGYGSGGGYWWRFTTCTTWNRACASSTEGSGEMVYPYP